LPEELADVDATKVCSSLSHELIRRDYQRFLTDYGFSEEVVRAVVDDWSDHIDLPTSFNLTTVGKSSIHGKGIFAVSPIAAGALIGPSRINKKRTVLGRLTNHSPIPNAFMQRVEDDPDSDLIVLASREIAEGEEVLVDYRQVGYVNGFSDN
jgi:hypothetical protein